jgi:hypothetical protein
MTQPIHTEESGEWTGYVWRRKEAPDEDTNYFWSLSYKGDVRQAADESPDGEDSPPNLIPDSPYYTSEDEARQAMRDQLKDKVAK